MDLASENWLEEKDEENIPGLYWASPCDGLELMGWEFEGFELRGFELRLLEFCYKIGFTPGDAKNDDPMLLFIRLLGFRGFFIG